MKPIIRNAKPGDEEGIVYAGVRGWQTSYTKILPLDFLSTMDKQIPKRTEEWKGHLLKPEICERTFVAEVSGKVVGFATGHKNRHETLPFESEILALYILKEHQRGGLGRKLVHAMVELFQKREQNSMVIAALKENHIARRFYETLGGELVGEATFELEGIKYPEVVYGWKDLELLSKQLTKFFLMNQRL